MNPRFVPMFRFVPIRKPEQKPPLVPVVPICSDPIPEQVPSTAFRCSGGFTPGTPEQNPQNTPLFRSTSEHPKPHLFRSGRSDRNKTNQEER